MSSWLVIGNVAQIPKGEGRTFDVRGQRIAVFHTHGGEAYATQPQCPHLGGPLADGLVGGTTVLCPLHDRAFDLRSGRCLAGDCANITTYPVSLQADGTIALQLEQGTAASAA